MMDLGSEAAIQQSSKLDEFVLVSRRIRKAGRGAHASSPTVRKSSPTANGSFAFASPEFREAPSKLSPSLSEDEGSKEGRIANSDQAFSAPSRDQSRLQRPSKEEKAPSTWSDGDGAPRGALPQRSSPQIAPLDIATKIREDKLESLSTLRDALPSHGGETPSEGLTKSSCGIETW
jgi:hypothetical protein